jgi:hypothetical protein
MAQQILEDRFAIDRIDDGDQTKKSDVIKPKILCDPFG